MKKKKQPKLVISCHADTGFRSHRLNRVNGVFVGHLDNFAGVHAAMNAYFSGRMTTDSVRIELTYGEETNMEGACEVRKTLSPDDVVVVVDVTGTETERDITIEKCRSPRMRCFVCAALNGLSYALYEGCPDPIADADECDVYGEDWTTSSFWESHAPAETTMRELSPAVRPAYEPRQKPFCVSPRDLWSTRMPNDRLHRTPPPQRVRNPVRRDVRQMKTLTKTYIHGYNARENIRLQDQAMTLADLLHSDTVYPAGSHVLEAGCGVGAQTVTLARNSPGALIVSIGTSKNSVAQAEQKIRTAGLANVRFQQGDIFHLPFAPQSFDHVFVCFVLERLKEPYVALQKLRTALRPNGTITVIEGDHGSAYFHPDSDAAHAAIHCQVELQFRAGGNALIGRSLYPLLITAGYRGVRVSPRMVYVDSSKPELTDGLTKKTFTAMIEGVRQSAIDGGIIDPATFDKGIKGLHRTTGPDGTFCYTFFKAVGQA